MVYWNIFLSAGQRQQENAKKLLHLAAERLVRAGAKEVEYHGEGSMLTFQVRLRREMQEYTSVGYRLWVMPGAEQYQLQQAALWGRDQQTAGVLRWYVRHRNEELPRGIFYRQDPVLAGGQDRDTQRMGDGSGAAGRRYEPGDGRGL